MKKAQRGKAQSDKGAEKERHKDTKALRNRDTEKIITGFRTVEKEIAASRFYRDSQ